MVIVKQITYSACAVQRTVGINKAAPSLIKDWHHAKDDAGETPLVNGLTIREVE